ncbi:hypothetical protein MUA41_00835 [Staphylococcus simulans]|uniref:hypothetical protein n=1 Tax=Staphylococcus simulans TaxID=1286 RepID=UPI0021D3A48B|nr:hypothetical protein [Staphylococcus simulans]UXR38044.1 hypothetical protein MUA41_00835 [Staphylococcus simulans]
MSNYHKYPIVDTDIWVSLVFSKYYKRLIKKLGHLTFSDVVAREIKRWDKNQSDAKEISTKFTEMLEKQKISIITFEEFSYYQQMSINHQLQEYNLQNVNISERNKGEFVSLLYALHLDIKLFKTNDHKFAKALDEHTKTQIHIMHWEEILKEYSESFKERIYIEKLVNNKQEKMTKQKEKYQQDPRWDKLKKLL